MYTKLVDDSKKTNNETIAQLILSIMLKTSTKVVHKKARQGNINLNQCSVEFLPSVRYNQNNLEIVKN